MQEVVRNFNINKHMKSLTEFILEELDTTTLNRIKALRIKNKKEALVAIKKALSNKDENELKELAEKIYSSVGNYKDPDDLYDAIDNGKIDGWKEMYDEIVKLNKNNEVDTDTVIDVIEKIANGQRLDAAITEIAKKI